MRAIHRLSTMKVTHLKKPGYYADGGNLYLRVTSTNTRSWIFRYTVDGRTRDAGLGVFPAVSLVKAREHAQKYRELVADGIDPIEARKGEHDKARLASAKAMTFEQCARAFIASHETGWKHRRSAPLWHAALDTYVNPIFGALPVSAIDTGLVLKVIEPLWKEKVDTASRVRGRIERVLDWAKVRGHREGENPARWRGHLDHLLPAKGKVQAAKHHTAVPYREIGTLMAKLRAETVTSARALEFLVLTATRLSETLDARWDEFDLESRMWTIPGARMKAGREHRVPLSTRAMAILKEMAEIRTNEFVFPGTNAGRPMTRNVLARLLARLGSAGVPHGFRSSFRDWAAEMTNSPREAAELALAHAVGDAVERAYQRGDLLEKRRKLMEAWAAYCAQLQSGANVVPIKHRSMIEPRG